MGPAWDFWLRMNADGRLLVLVAAQNLPQMQNGIANSQIVTEKVSALCNHVCVDATQDKQQSIEDEWVLLEISCSE